MVIFVVAYLEIKKRCCYYTGIRRYITITITGGASELRTVEAED